MGLRSTAYKMGIFACLHSRLFWVRAMPKLLKSLGARREVSMCNMRHSTQQVEVFPMIFLVLLVTKWVWIQDFLFSALPLSFPLNGLGWPQRSLSMLRTWTPQEWGGRRIREWKQCLAQILARSGAGHTPGRIAWWKVLSCSMNHEEAPNSPRAS